MGLCRVIAHFVPNFVPIATRVSRGKVQLAAFAGPSTFLRLDSISPNRISPNLFFDRRTNNNDLLCHFFASLASSVLSFIIFSVPFFWPTVSKYTTGVVSFRLISFCVVYLP